MTVAVNVKQLWKPHLTRLEADEVISGDWPLRRGVTRADVEAAADILVAVRRNKAVAVRRICEVQSASSDGYRVRFHLADADESWQAILKRPTPDILRWRQGETWPIKIVDTKDLVAAMEGSSLANEPADVVVGGFTVRLVSRSRLEVVAPHAATVVIIGSLR